MIRIKAICLSEEEKQRFVDGIKKQFQVLTVSKVYKSGKYQRIYVDVK